MTGGRTHLSIQGAPVMFLLSKSPLGRSPVDLIVPKAWAAPLRIMEPQRESNPQAESPRKYVLKIPIMTRREFARCRLCEGVKLTYREWAAYAYIDSQ